MPAWPSLQQLHEVFHITLALQPVSPDFSLSPTYLQSLMMLVVLVLGMGFAILVLLALFLCLVISFVPPVTSPPLLLRLLVVSVAGSLAFTSYVSMAANDEYADGMNDLLRNIDGVGVFSRQVEMKALPLAEARDEFNSRVAPLYACELCYRSIEASSASASASASAFASAFSPNLRNSSVCVGLTSGISAMQKGSTFVADATAAPARVEHVLNLLRRSSGWHAWAASLPCFALLTTCCAIIFGTLRGRRNILVSGQFFSVIIWWMMCAVVSVEFAIAVGLADACLEPIATVQRVLKQFATERQSVVGEGLRTYELTMHYIYDCTEPNPLANSLMAMLDGTATVTAALSNVTRCADSIPPLVAAMEQLRLRVQDALGGLGSCGRDGAMGKLFQAGVEQGLCGSAAAGITRVFVRQTVCGALLLLLTSLLPWLWHSHHLPPLSRRALVPRFVVYFRWRRVDTDNSFDAPLMASAIRYADEAAMQPSASIMPEMSMSTPAASQGATTLEHSGGSQASGAERSAAVSPLDDGRLRQCSNHEAL